MTILSLILGALEARTRFSVYEICHMMPSKQLLIVPRAFGLTRQACCTPACIITYLNSQSLMLSWFPGVDGAFLTDVPTRLAGQGKIARVPIISGEANFTNR
jgi:hypothetical protein